MRVIVQPENFETDTKYLLFHDLVDDADIVDNNAKADAVMQIQEQGDVLHLCYFENEEEILKTCPYFHNLMAKADTILRLTAIKAGDELL